MNNKYYVIVNNPNGWDEGCPDWQGVFFGDIPNYSDEYRGVGCTTKAEAKKIKRTLDTTGDWDDNDEHRTEYRPTYAIHPVSDFVSLSLARTAARVMDIVNNPLG